MEYSKGAAEYKELQEYVNTDAAAAAETVTDAPEMIFYAGDRF